MKLTRKRFKETPMKTSVNEGRNYLFELDQGVEHYKFFEEHCLMKIARFKLRNE